MRISITVGNIKKNQIYRVKLALRERRQTLTRTRPRTLPIRIPRRDNMTMMRQVIPARSTTVIARPLVLRCARPRKLVSLVPMIRQMLPCHDGGEYAHLMIKPMMTMAFFFFSCDGGGVRVVSLRVCHGRQWQGPVSEWTKGATTAIALN